jgi:hypothetical protein
MIANIFFAFRKREVTDTMSLSLKRTKDTKEETINQMKTISKMMTIVTIARMN